MSNPNEYKEYKSDKSRGYFADSYGRIRLDEPEDFEASGEFFSASDTAAEYRPLNSKAKKGGNFELRNNLQMSPERIVDLICIPITLIGLLLIALNFEKVMYALACLIYPVIEVTVFVLIIALIVAIIYGIIRFNYHRRRWR